MTINFSPFSWGSKRVLLLGLSNRRVWRCEDGCSEEKMELWLDMEDWIGNRVVMLHGCPNRIIEEQCIFYTVFNITYFSHHVHCINYVGKKLRKQTIFNINTHFMIRTTTSTTVIQQGNFWSWNKTAYMTMKDREDCSRSGVPYVILIIWITVTVT